MEIKGDFFILCLVMAMYVGLIIGLVMCSAWILEPMQKEIGTPICAELGLEYKSMDDDKPYTITCINTTKVVEPNTDLFGVEIKRD